MYILSFTLVFENQTRELLEHITVFYPCDLIAKTLDSSFIDIFSIATGLKSFSPNFAFFYSSNNKYA